MKMEKLVVDIELFREEEPISSNRKYISKFTLPGLPYREPFARLVQEPSPSLRAHGRGESMVGYFQDIENILGFIISGMPTRTPRQFSAAPSWKSLVWKLKLFISQVQ